MPKYKEKELEISLEFNPSDSLLLVSISFPYIPETNNADEYSSDVIFDDRSTSKNNSKYYRMHKFGGDIWEEFKISKLGFDIPLVIIFDLTISTKLFENAMV